MTNNVVGCLCYLLGWLTGLIFLLIDPYKNDRFVRFHAFQSIFFDVALFALWIGLWIVGGILTVLTRGFAAPLMLLLWLAFMACWLGGKIFLMVKAYNNQQFKLPFIGDLAAKQVGG